MSNEGKRFEQDFIESVPAEWFKYRLNDSGGAWQGGDKARFTPSNICDFIVYNGNLWLLELKSHKGKSIPLSCIRPKQVKGLTEACTKGVDAGYIINFRDTEETYFISVFGVNNYIKQFPLKKSISLSWLKGYGILIPQVKRKTRYGYILQFMEVS